MIGFTKAEKKESQTLSMVDGSFAGDNDGGTNLVEREPTGGLTYWQMEMMYRVNAWVRAVVDRNVTRTVDHQAEMRPMFKKKPGDMKSSTISRRTRAHLKKTDAILKNPNQNMESFQNIRKKVHRGVQKFDAGCMELVKSDTPNSDGGYDVEEVYATPGHTIRMNVDDRGIFTDKSKAYYQVDDSGTKGAKFAIDELLYMMDNPQDTSIYGLSPLESLRQTVTAELYASDHNLKFFSNNARPNIALLFNKLGLGMGQATMNRVKNWWNKELRGQPHKPIIMGTEGGEIDLHTLNIPNKDMEFQAYSEWLLMKILAVYKSQPFVLGIITGTTGKLNSEQQSEQYNIDAIKPQLTLFSNQWNIEAIWSPRGFNYDDVYMDWSGFSVVDQKKSAEVDEINLRNGVVTIDQVRETRGWEPVPWGGLPYMQNNVSQLGIGVDPAELYAPILGNKKPDGKKPDGKKPDPATAAAKHLVRLLATKPYLKAPVGDEDELEGDKKTIFHKILNEREQMLDKFYMFMGEMADSMVQSRGKRRSKK